MTDFLPSFLAATEAAGEHAAEEAAGLNAIGLDPLAILAQAVTFLVLFWIVKKFALEGIVNTLEERRRIIDKGVRLGIEMQSEREKLEADIEKQLQAARLSADRILADANKEAGVIVKNAEAKAAQKVDTMISDARARITDDVRKAKYELEKEVIDLVAEATEIIINEKLDKSKDEQFIKRLLSEAKGE